MLNGTTEHNTEVPKLSLIRADRAMLDNNWPFIRRKLVALKAKYKRKAPRTKLRWIPEQVRIGIIRGFENDSVQLFFSLDPAGIIKAFAITEVAFDPFRHAPIDMFIWILWADSTPTKGIRNARVLERSIDLLAKEAVTRGCIGLKHMSPFVAWGRRTEKMGFNLEYIVWRLELAEET